MQKKSTYVLQINIFLSLLLMYPFSPYLFLPCKSPEYPTSNAIGQHQLDDETLNIVDDILLAGYHPFLQH